MVEVQGMSYNYGAAEEALRDFDGEITEPMNEIIVHVARCGVSRFGWAGLRKLLRAKMISVTDKAHADTPFIPIDDSTDCSFEAQQARLVAWLESFEAGSPFTLQRMAEVLLSPGTYYKGNNSTNKLLTALEKLLSVSSTEVQPMPDDGLAFLQNIYENT